MLYNSDQMARLESSVTELLHVLDELNASIKLTGPYLREQKGLDDFVPYLGVGIHAANGDIVDFLVEPVGIVNFRVGSKEPGEESYFHEKYATVHQMAENWPGA